MTIVRSTIIECDRCHMFEDYKYDVTKDGIPFYHNDNFIRVKRFSNIRETINDQYLCRVCNEALDAFMNGE